MITADRINAAWRANAQAGRGTISPAPPRSDHVLSAMFRYGGPMPETEPARMFFRFRYSPPWFGRCRGFPRILPPEDVVISR